MESRFFIKEAKALIEEIKLAGVVAQSYEEEQAKRQNLQKRVNTLFQGLMNPTLPSAFNLRDTAQEHGYSVAPQVLHRLAQFDAI